VPWRVDSSAGAAVAVKAREAMNAVSVVNCMIAFGVGSEKVICMDVVWVSEEGCCCSDRWERNAMATYTYFRVGGCFMRLA
jgi:hypothetical protein